MRVNPPGENFSPLAKRDPRRHDSAMTTRLFLLGATGRLGGHVLRAALARGYAVTALVRDPARLAAPGLTVVRGDVCDLAALAAALPHHDAVISALGTRRGQEPAEVISEGMRNLVAAMAASGVHRVIAVASAGILQADAERLRRDAPGYPEAFRRSSAAHLEAYGHLRESRLDWTVVCPPELVEGAPEQPLTVAADYLPPGPKRVSMPALAGWMLDALADPATYGHRFGLIDAPPQP